MDGNMSVAERVARISRSVAETWETLPMADQLEWGRFFSDYLQKVVAKQDFSGMGGAMAQLWALSQEYYRVYGPLWE